LISIGTELLLGEILDTNARYLSERLAALGVTVHWRVTVGDNLERCAAAFRQALARSDLVIACGGLGPTGDDLTRQALARALGTELVHSPEAWEQVQAYFRMRGRVAGAHDRRQALILPGARVLPNTRGTAPGMEVTTAEQRVLLLPGPPNELLAMFEEQVVPVLGQAGGSVLVSRWLRLAGIGESRVSERLDDLFSGENPTLAPYAGLGEVRLRITARAETTQAARAQIAGLEQRVRERLEGHVYGVDDEDLETVVGRELACRRLTLAVAESCTGGLLGHRLTNVPGSSAYFRLGVVAYANDLKSSCLGVAGGVLERHGAVSAQVALAMAQGVRRLAASDYALGITGIAGPDGGSAEKPVGLVYLALAGGNEQVWEHRFGGGRQDVKWRATQQALVELWRELVSPGGGRQR
jgi:nicotinamide-nucleotide amidase